MNKPPAMRLKLSDTSPRNQVSVWLCLGQEFCIVLEDWPTLSPTVGKLFFSIMNYNTVEIACSRHCVKEKIVYRRKKPSSLMGKIYRESYKVDKCLTVEARAVILISLSLITDQLKPRNVRGH